MRKPTALCRATMLRPAVWLAAALALGGLAPSYAHGQTLRQAMARAYFSHPAIAAQRANLGALDADVDSARGGWRPTVSLSTSAGRNITSYDPKGGLDTQKNYRNPSDVRINASQPLLNWSTRPAVDAAQTRVSQGQADLLATEQDVLLEVATAYLNVLQARQLVALNEANERSLARQVEYRQAYFQRKLGTRTELAQARARHAGALAQLDRARADLDIADSAFLRHVGEAPEKLSFPSDLPPLPDSLDTILANAAENRPAVRSAYLGTEAARADVEAAKGKLKPSLSLEAAGAWVREPGETLQSQRDASVQLTLRIPLYQAGVQRAQVRGNTQRAIQQQARWRDLRLQARYDAEDAWRKLGAARAQIKAFSAAIAANKVAYEGVRETHATLGDLTLIEVLNAQQELFQSETSLVQARTQAALSHLRLLGVQGRLTAQAMGLLTSQ